MDENLSDVSDSILLSVKKLVGISEEDNSFDLDIMLHINAALSVLYQLGVLEEPYMITSQDETYLDMLPGGSKEVISMIKLYLVYKVKVGFDPTTLSTTVIETFKELIKELEWRLMIEFNPKDTFKAEGEEEFQNE